ncbi:hypothetical protein [Halomicrococcus sp. NG-SE-24]|uniref:hypothetical protein n=1 Tax=Halomicrococcus sp. NG-SE-24 TaxID=3436928 RepID=UPI003D964BFA
MNVRVELTGSLVARTGTRDARVAVPESATVADVIDKLGEKCGPQATAGIVDTLGIRPDTRIVRESRDASEPVSVNSPVEPGDTVRVQPTA